jgi:hypothetical protein
VHASANPVIFVNSGALIRLLSAKPNLLNHRQNETKFRTAPSSVQTLRDSGVFHRPMAERLVYPETSNQPRKHKSPRARFVAGVGNCCFALSSDYSRLI